MTEEQSKALRLLSERASVDPAGYASTQGIEKRILGELFRRGHISKPKRGQVKMVGAGAAFVLGLQSGDIPNMGTDEDET